MNRKIIEKMVIPVAKDLGHQQLIDCAGHHLVDLVSHWEVLKGNHQDYLVDNHCNQGDLLQDDTFDYTKNTLLTLKP